MFRKAIITAALFSASLPAFAGPMDAGAAQSRTVQVHAHDLNLASEVGRAALRERVGNAVHEICQVADWGSTLEAKRAGEACSAKAMTTAMVQVDAMILAAQSNRVAHNQDVSVTSR